MRELAYETIVTMLLNRKLIPGEFLSQRRLVETTGLPLGAIREIIPRMESEGLLTALPQRGIQIASLDLNFIREAFQFRLFMEREAVALFTLSASDEQIATLRRNHENMLELARTRPLTAEEEEEAQALDWSMHNDIINSVGNSIFSDAYRVNSIKTRLIDLERYTIRGRVIPSMEDHLKIITAIQQRNPELAVQELTNHLNNSKAVALSV